MTAIKDCSDGAVLVEDSHIVNQTDLPVDPLAERITDLSLSPNHNGPRADHVILDTSACVHASMDQMSSFAPNLYLVQNIQAEIKDKRTRTKLSLIPQNFFFREPSDEHVDFVKEFAKKAGIYQRLSLPDIKAVALTYHLHIENCGKAGLNSEPLETTNIKQREENPEESTGVTKKNPDLDIPGFYEPEVKQTEEEGPEVEEEAEDDDDDIHNDDGWITSSNLKEAQSKFDNIVEEETPVKVACVTTDYAMQLLLAQIGLNILTVNGMKVAKITHYVLRCQSCNRNCVDLSKKFCPECGNKTLVRLSYHVEDDGTRVYHFSRRFKYNKRGLKYAVPRPQGGKHGVNPWVAEDQRFPMNKPPKRDLQRNAPLDPDYVANDTPFLYKDVTSRHFSSKVFNPWLRPNPTAPLPNTGNKKRRNNRRG